MWHNKVLRTLAFVDLTVTGLYMPMESVLFPKYFTDRNEPAHLGWVLMALSIGGLIGALGYAVLSKYMKKRTTMLVAVLTLGVAMTVIAFLPPLPLILALCVDRRPGLRPDRADLQLRHADPRPAHLRGRVVGVMGSLAYAAGPLGLILAGPLADAAGLQTTFLALSLPMLVDRSRRGVPPVAARTGRNTRLTRRHRAFSGTCNSDRTDAYDRVMAPQRSTA